MDVDGLLTVTGRPLLVLGKCRCRPTSYLSALLSNHGCENIYTLSCIVECRNTKIECMYPNICSDKSVSTKVAASLA